MMVELENDEWRFCYCIDPLLGLDTFARGYLENRAFSAAGAMLGRSAKTVRANVRSCAARGSAGAYLDWLREIGIQFRLSPAATSNEGFVYQARLPQFPGLIKIGFSQRDPFRRAEEISSETGCKHQIEDFAPGNIFDETRQFLARRYLHVANEWFFDPLEDVSAMPPFLACRVSLEEWRAARKTCLETSANIKPLGLAYGGMLAHSSSGAGA